MNNQTYTSKSQAQAHAAKLNGIHSHAGTRSMGLRHRVVVRFDELFAVVMLGTAQQIGAEVVK